MKKVLIVGKNSYIGTSFAAYAERNLADLSIDFISIRDSSWQEMDLSDYDTILFCAAIVHRKETSKMIPLYQKINCLIPIEFAIKAKSEGVKQFIFMSTMAIYGLEGKIGETVVIDAKTPEKPNTVYAQSKLAAEKALQELAAPNFKITILRPPMVYGAGCPGNYQRMRRFILKRRIFPTLKNQRSMIYIENLCSFLHQLIRDGIGGVFHPQDPEPICTLEMAQLIAQKHEVKLRLCPLLNPAIRILSPFIDVLNKVWGSLIYSQELSQFNANSSLYSLSDSIRLAEKKNADLRHRKKQILFLCQYFYPEYVSSATLPFDTALALMNAGYTVDAMCGFPKEYTSEKSVPAAEIVKDIKINRIRYFQSDRSNFAGRLCNIFSFTLSVLMHISRIKGYEVIFVYSNPPILPLIPVLAHKLFGTKFVFVCYDVYPEIAIRTHSASNTGIMTQTMNIVNNLVYKNVALVVALSSEMKSFLAENRPITSNKIKIIPNWYEAKTLVRSPLTNETFLPYRDKFVVSYLGNMGICQDMDTILDCIKHLNQDNSIQFLFAGHGGKKTEIEKAIYSEGLTNARVFDFLQGSEYDEILSISSCFLISLEQGLTGLCVPSKTYGYMMAGRPIVAIIDAPSDIAEDLERGQAGYVIKNRDGTALAHAILDLKNDPQKAQAMGLNARSIFMDNYTRDICTSKYVELVSQLSDSYKQ